MIPSPILVLDYAGYNLELYQQIFTLNFISQYSHSISFSLFESMFTFFFITLLLALFMVGLVTLYGVVTFLLASFPPSKQVPKPGQALDIEEIGSVQVCLGGMGACVWLLHARLMRVLCGVWSGLWSGRWSPVSPGRLLASTHTFSPQLGSGS